MTSKTKERKDRKNGQDESNRHVTPLKLILLFSVSGEKTEVAIAILPLLYGKGWNMQTQGIRGVYLCKCTLYV